MINRFEHSKINFKSLPNEWQEEGALGQLEAFLQNNWEQRSIFYSDGYITSRQQFVDFDVRNGIKIQNYIGTIVFKGEQLNIFPKVFKTDVDDTEVENLNLTDLINNLVIWLGYCDKLNFPFVSMKSDIADSDNLLELFIKIYTHYVKTVIDKQRYYQYEDIIENGTLVKGKINFSDYSTKKYPMGNHHQMEYRYSSFIHDNQLNRIIKFTCHFLLSVSKERSSKDVLKRILMRLGDVSKVNCLPHDCDSVHLSSLNMNYKIILSLSKVFLLNKVNTFDIGGSESFCFLFPAEVLFEGFVGGYLKEILTDKVSVSTQTSDQYLADLIVDGEEVGSAFMLKEDIVVESKDSIYILDTKYKLIDKFEKVKVNKKLEISDADMKQMAIYATKRGAKKVFLLYPLLNHEPPETMSIRYDLRLDALGQKPKIPLEILKIPFVFSESVDKTKEQLKRILLKEIIV
jgi:5-methylcytosine-specific restriction enzyme subunit McrC